ncbi:adenylyltransferase/cytidyltransferase family protein [Aliiroseovarius marinus]|uniref:adenylyltransferase/cytidyltransferase family protein n=1 Tax=Aliiroseovarius marinus TaxID=2500159 RepID=UPI003D7D3980
MNSENTLKSRAKSMARKAALKAQTRLPFLRPLAHAALALKGRVMRGPYLKELEKLHAQAKAQFQAQDRTFDIEPALKALDRVGYADLGLSHEARVMLCLSVLTKNGPMRQSMKLLQAHRAQQGDSDAFQAFEDYLLQHVPQDHLLGHGYGRKTFSNRAHGEIWTKVENVLSVLSKYSDKVFLNSGTLLGVVRDGKLIDHDDDVDLAVVLEASSQEEAGRAFNQLQQELIAHGYARPHKPKQGGYDAIIKFDVGDGMVFDLFPAWIEGDKLNVYPYLLGEAKSSDLLPLKTCEITGLPIPSNPERLLEVNYGENWRTPDRYWRFEWLRAQNRFRKFLASVKETRPKRVITYGTFDLFHYGHVRLLKRLSRLADEVIVACSTDEFNEVKGKKTAVPYEQRVEMLKSCRFVTKVIAERSWDQKRADITRLKADVFAIGDDWAGEFDDLSDICNVVYLPRTQNISTTMLKDDIRSGAGKADGAQKGVDGKARSPA